jgi:hypothetical protein
MAKKKHYSKHSKKIPLAIVIPGALSAYNIAQAGINKDMNSVRLQTTGIDSNGHFYLPAVIETYGPIVVGVIAHKYVGKHINRYIPGPVGL